MISTKGRSKVQAEETPNLAAQLPNGPIQAQLKSLGPAERCTYGADLRKYAVRLVGLADRLDPEHRGVVVGDESLVAGINAQLTKAKSAVADKEAQISQLRESHEAQAKQLQDTYVDCEIRLKEAIEERDGQRSVIGQRETQLKKLMDELQSREAQIQQLMVAYDEQQSGLQQLAQAKDGELMQLREQLQSCEADIQQWAASHEDLQKANEQLRRDAQQMQVSLAAAQAKAAQATQQIEVIKSLITGGAPPAAAGANEIA